MWSANLVLNMRRRPFHQLFPMSGYFKNISCTWTDPFLKVQLSALHTLKSEKVDFEPNTLLIAKEVIEYCWQFLGTVYLSMAQASVS